MLKILMIVLTTIQILKHFITQENITTSLFLLISLLTFTQPFFKDLTINLIASYIFQKLNSPKYKPKHNIRPKLKPK
jgi:hypothetical protein